MYLLCNTLEILASVAGPFGREGHEHNRRRSEETNKPSSYLFLPLEIMFVEAFSARHVHGWRNTLPPSSPLPIVRRSKSQFPVITAEAAPTTTASIEFVEESLLHIVTLPPFAPTNKQNDDGYPSPLHQIHILPLLMGDETAELLQLARNHATENQSWDRLDSSRHVSYPTVDFAIDESW